MIVGAKTQNLKIMSLLLHYNGSAVVENYKDENALTIASDLGNEEMMELLAPTTCSIFQKYLSVQATMSIRQSADPFRVDLFRSESGTESGSDRTSANPFRSNIGVVRFNISAVSEQSTESPLISPNRVPSEIQFGHTAAESVLNAKADFQYPSSVGTTPEPGDTSSPGVSLSPGISEIAANSQSPNFIDTLDDEEKEKFRIVKLKQQNPFGHIKNVGTRKLLYDLHQIVDENKDLPILEGWIQKKSMRQWTWKKRWIVVAGNYVLWSKEQKVIHNPRNQEEREEFGRYVLFSAVTGRDGIQ